ncbi:alanine--tRNA ligase [Effusibacillus lacus]|uniref:Alanine--tRNA ligase n=1 Tax=Effusibacillus lacus TaxID=1348429 RepID=A0A292YJ66_9BACL|nr:alanine--tRNA ligase [Effusibacillus lacus]TCS74357.1 alanyl-tRNA synthetase [Effusibacillus lacus]GAX88813.1 alanine--tRNA ligase [Effusibacillus lacus]
MKSYEIREKFLRFFESKGHDIVPSASLVPYNDPSLLWINAGMAPLKKYFDGSEVPKNPRMTNSQKCIRTNDIENVGKTARHHTFFEMLGNFSIGDYFKREAIHWAWEFLTSKEWIGFDKDRLYVTVHHEDDEAFKVWNEEIGIPAEKIARTESDNFWDIGEGPCGPCSEIFYDRNPERGQPEDFHPDLDGGNRFLEVWNLVFSQFNHNPDGTYTELPKKNIDTGAGLERFCSLLQNGETNFDTDLFLPIIEETSRISGKPYREKEEWDVAFKVIADHVRTVTFSVGDGALPSNEGRGYVIRRLLRRAVRYGKVLGIEKPFLFRLVKVVGDIMGMYYSEVVQKREFIERVIKAEEERFSETLQEGENLLAEVIARVKADGKTVIPGEDVFRLYDTYGFPIDLTEDIAYENHLTIDREGFEKALQEQRERARAARKDISSMQVQNTVFEELGELASTFVGYTETASSGIVLAIIKDGEIAKSAHEGDVVEVVLDHTPFYAESGGQVADKGIISVGEKAQLQVMDVQKAPNGYHLHKVKVISGEVNVMDTVEASIDTDKRADIIKNHTGTHLLHKALREVLGEHVAQAGSLVESDRLRFDFSHLSAMTPEEIAQVEQKVNEQIWANTPVEIREMPIDEAKKMGAMALFGEKYGDVVRVVKAGDYSVELCGGCHVARTGEIGIFKIVSESSIGAGIRRVEAVTGRGAYEYMQQQTRLLEEVAGKLKSSVNDIPFRIDVLQSNVKELSKEIESLKGKLASYEVKALVDKVQQMEGIPYIAAELSGLDMDGLRNVAEDLRNRIGSGVVVVGGTNEGKVNFVAAVTKDLVAKGLQAGKIVKEVAAITGGGGGGRPELAQAGGRDASKVPGAISQVPEILKKQLASV